MLYDIRLSISYSYAHPAGASRSLLRMLPRATEAQDIVAGEVTVEPRPDYRRDGVDFFGNATSEVAHDAMLKEIRFGFDGRVRRRGMSDLLDLSSDLRELAAEIAHTRSIAPSSPHHFLGESPRIHLHKAIAAFAADAAAGTGSALATVEAVNSAVHGEITFDSTATDVTTDPLTAFEARRGVCQDMSHIMIAALRSLGIPAGYVSGFLRTDPPEGQPRLEGADAMHAWVRAWCGAEMGWIEIDPTNDIRAGQDHVMVGFGRDYFDVAPVKGSLRSMGPHQTTHSVDVVPVD
ncbi:transglutaminase family protein [Rhodobacterales bacterium HKCCE2091]|nr:transglutaminase family protein [Rhodobacterales bacterium HKCCE2091]